MRKTLRQNFGVTFRKKRGDAWRRSIAEHKDFQI
jgi:hypothetical protein